MRQSLLTVVSLTALTACSSVDPTVQETAGLETGGDTTAVASSDPATGPENTNTSPTSDPSSPTTGSVTTGESGGGSSTGGETTNAGTTTGVGTTEAGTTQETSTSTGPDMGTDTGTSGESTGEPKPDSDGDGVPDEDDNCVDDANPDQKDLDKDGVGDVCDPDDTDGDKILDGVDNCPLVANPDQKDADTDGIGDVCDEDKDGDGIPNDVDVFPNDGMQPGVVMPKQIYAHSSSKLFTVDVETYVVGNLPNFQWPNDGGGHQMTDLAIDRNGVLYGVTFDRLYVCNPTTSQCFNLGTLPGTYNGLSWIPAGILDPDKDTLIGITQQGGWVQLTIMNGQVIAKQLGTYGAGYTSAGDAFSIEGVGTFAAVHKAGLAGGNVIVTVDPTNGKVTGELAQTKGYSSVFGLAGWEGLILAFDSSGQVIKIDPVTKVVTNLGNKGVAWWGAGVGTVIPQ